MGLFYITLATALVLGVTSVAGQLGGAENPQFLYLKKQVDDAAEICPTDQPGVNGERPVDCRCDLDTEISLPAPKALDFISIGIILGCSPGNCTCRLPDPTKSSTEPAVVSVRPPEMQALMGLCEREGKELDGCYCASTRPRRMPKGKYIKKQDFDLKELFFTCRPRTCKCKAKGSDDDSETTEHPVQAFGCKDGGALYCRAGRGDFVCMAEDTGTVLKVLTRDHLLDARLKKQCVCENGSYPRCISTGLPPQCPGGDWPDFTFGNPGDGLIQCTPPPEYN